MFGFAGEGKCISEYQFRFHVDIVMLADSVKPKKPLPRMINYDNNHFQGYLNHWGALL